jgi:excisionase family DNA binding protein
MKKSELQMVCLTQVVTADEACQMLGVTRKRVLDLCKSNRLVARQASKGRAWLISKESVEDRLNGKVS